MSEGEVSQGLALDPFAHLPGVASRILGLGGSTAGHDPGYAFHTAYVDVAPGYAEFFIRFDRLRGKQGTLMLRVHMLPKEEGAHAILATSQRISFSRLVAQNGVIGVRFEAFRDVIYALYGSVLGDTDAEAHRLEITLDRPAGTEEPERIVVDPRTTAYGRDAARPAPFMISLEKAALSRPTCQIATTPQLEEQAAADWLAAGELRNITAPARRWSAAYILQTLSRFGMLTPGARGLGTGLDAPAIAAAIAGTGPTITVLEPGDAESGGVIAASDRVSMVQADPGALGADIVNYDFAWSVGTASQLGSIADGVNFIRDIVARLRPGGLAVHVLAYNLSSADDTIERGDTVLFRRVDVERILLTMISLGHEVAQLRIDTDHAVTFDYPGNDPDDYLASLCGILIRKATTAL